MDTIGSMYNKNAQQCSEQFDTHIRHFSTEAANEHRLTTGMLYDD